MEQSLFKVTVAALFHDIGKVIHRSEVIDSRAHPVSGCDFISNYTEDKDILDAIKYHHKKDMQNATLSQDSLAYITYFSDNIAAATDRRDYDYIEGSEECSGFDKHLPMTTVFNLILNNNKKMQLEYKNVQEVNFPKNPAEGSNISISRTQYNKCFQNIRDSLAGVKFEPEYINSLIELLETHLAYIPSSTSGDQVPDISLYDHQKLTAAISSCIYLYLSENNRTNFKEELYRKEESFKNEKSLLMFSCDISGIQNFIYTISSEGALKGLRSRSFYLEILLEHIVDRLVQKIGLSRANIIYTGGGHAYILLPNTEKTKDVISSSMKNVNRWFLKNFGISLYIASSYVECSCNDLKNEPYDEEPYSRVFRELSRKISLKKQRRYTAEDIKMLNSGYFDKNGRECRVCGSADMPHDKDEKMCKMCLSLNNISRLITRQDTVIITSGEEIHDSDVPFVCIPSLEGSSNYLYILNKDKARDVLSNNSENVLNVYGRNKMHTGLSYSRNVWTGTYNYKINNITAAFEDLAEGATGIKRLAVLRADVDNLGTAFVSGFIRENETDSYKRSKYQTLSRTATLSRQMSMFFKYYINLILEKSVGEIEPFSLKVQSCDKSDEGRKAVIVYSGGDDMFIVGAWDDIIEAAVDIKRAFDKYSAGTMTFSAGIGIFPAKYPISRMAELTAQLEEAAKSMDSNKNAISLFGIESFIKDGEYITAAMHTYKWDVFINDVVCEKLRLLQKYLSDFEDSRGNSFLYKLMDYIKKIDEDRINIARIAYLLGRVAPVESEKRDSYNMFSRKVYNWIFNADDRRRLLTAIQLYIYLNREDKED